LHRRAAVYNPLDNKSIGTNVIQKMSILSGMTIQANQLHLITQYVSRPPDNGSESAKHTDSGKRSPPKDGKTKKLLPKVKATLADLPDYSKLAGRATCFGSPKWLQNSKEIHFMDLDVLEEAHPHVVLRQNYEKKMVNYLTRSKKKSIIKRNLSLSNTRIRTNADLLDEDPKKVDHKTSILVQEEAAALPTLNRDKSQQKIPYPRQTSLSNIIIENESKDSVTGSPKASKSRYINITDQSNERYKTRSMNSLANIDSMVFQEARQESNLNNEALIKYVASNPAVFPGYKSYVASRMKTNTKVVNSHNGSSGIKSDARGHKKVKSEANPLLDDASLDMLHKTIINNAPFIKFKIFENNLQKKGYEIQDMKRKQANTMSIVRVNKTECGKWPEAHSNKIQDMAQTHVVRAKDAQFERERLLAVQRLGLIIANPDWPLGEQLGTLFIEDQEERERKRTLVSQWLILLHFNQLYQRADIEYSKLKVAKGKQLLDRIRVKKLVGYCKKRMSEKLKNLPPENKVLPISPILALPTSLIANRARVKAKELLGAYFAQIVQTGQINQAVDDLTHLFLVAKKGTLFHFKVKIRKRKIKEAWDQAKELQLTKDKSRSSHQIVKQLEVPILEFLYLYYDCSQICGRVAECRARHPTHKQRFSGSALLKMLMVPKYTLVYNIVIECLGKHIEQVDRKDMSPGAGANIVGKEKGEKNARGNSKPRQENQKRQEAQHRSQHNTTNPSPTNSKSEPSNTTVPDFPYRLSPPQMDCQPFLPFSLSKHLDKNLMISIINAIIANIPQIHLHAIKFEGFFSN